MFLLLIPREELALMQLVLTDQFTCGDYSRSICLPDDLPGGLSGCYDCSELAPELIRMSLSPVTIELVKFTPANVG
jgi:hypothetical protein